MVLYFHSILQYSIVYYTKVFGNFSTPRIALVDYFTFMIFIRVHSQRCPLLIMPIGNMQWRVEIGIFNATSKARHFKKNSLRVAAPVYCFLIFGFCFVFTLLISFVCCDVELNPGRKNRNPCYNFSICHWNLKSITAHNFARVNLLQAYNS